MGNTLPEVRALAIRAKIEAKNALIPGDVWLLKSPYDGTQKLAMVTRSWSGRIAFSTVDGGAGVNPRNVPDRVLVYRAGELDWQSGREDGLRSAKRQR